MLHHTFGLLFKKCIRNLVGSGVVLFVLSGFTACASGPTTAEEVSIKQALGAGFARQVIHPDAPEGRHAPGGMPGELSSKIYRQRYVEQMSSDDKKKRGNQKASSEFD